MRILLMTGHEGAEVRQLNAALVAELGADAAAFPGLAKGEVFDSDTEAAARRWQAGMGIVADGVVGPYAQSLLGPVQAAAARRGARSGRGAQAVPRDQALEHRALPALCGGRPGRRRADRSPDDPRRPRHHPRRERRLRADLRVPLAVQHPAYSAWDGSSSTGEALGNWRHAAALAGLDARTQEIAPGKVVVRKPADAGQRATETSAGHGSFDNNVDVVARMLERITGQQLVLPVDDLRGF